MWNTTCAVAFCGAAIVIDYMNISQPVSFVAVFFLGYLAGRFGSKRAENAGR